ncbi:MAG: penicillin-binding protein activator LpoB [Spirochaetaceae bacterium]|nr:penicillin-binding protein activator LpoB [Spirochaetaceae bacterium]
MRKITFIFILIFVIMAVSAQSRLAGTNNQNTPVGPAQSEIIIDAGNSSRDIAVWINGTIIAHISPGMQERIIVPNGQNRVEVADTTFNSRNNQWSIGNRRSVMVNSQSNRVTIGLTLRYGAVINATITNTSAIGGGMLATQPPATVPPPVTNAPTSNQPPIVHAVNQAANVLVARIPNNVTIAVLSVGALNNREIEEAMFAYDRITFFLVNAGRFRIVDRGSLDSIRSEMRFQLSDEVNDNTAVRIGEMLGAQIVIVGQISGSGSLRTLTLRALDVQSAQIIAMASEFF